MTKLALILAIGLSSPFLTSCRTAQDLVNMPINLVNRITPGGLPNLPKLRLPNSGSGIVRTIR